MIRPLIKEQLEKGQFADLNNCNVNTNTFLIRKYCKLDFLNIKTK